MFGQEVELWGSPCPLVVKIPVNDYHRHYVIQATLPIAALWWLTEQRASVHVVREQGMKDFNAVGIIGLAFLRSTSSDRANASE